MSAVQHTEQGGGPAGADYDDGAWEQAAIDAAVEASKLQYNVEELVRKQRAVLARGFGSGQTSRFCCAQPATGLLGAGGTPVGVSAFFADTLQQRDPPAAGYSDQGWVFGGVNQAAGAVPPHFPADFTPAPDYAQYEPSAEPIMAAGDSASGVSECDGDGDDGLSSLLALCAVAG
jgi:hypothetical protein